MFSLAVKTFKDTFFVFLGVERILGLKISHKKRNMEGVYIEYKYVKQTLFLYLSVLNQHQSHIFNTFFHPFVKFMPFWHSLCECMWASKRLVVPSLKRKKIHIWFQFETNEQKSRTVSVQKPFVVNRFPDKSFLFSSLS
jgi:hypothetical protein